MDNQAAFLRFISNEYSIDYWSDVAIEEAVVLAHAMSPAEWAALSTDWERLPPNAQARLAEVASEVSTGAPSIPLMLIAMLSSSDSEVVEASLDSLNSISQSSPERFGGLDIGPALDKIKPAGNACASILESLRRRVFRNV